MQIVHQVLLPACAPCRVRLQLESDVLNGGDPIVQEVHLTAPIQFPLDGIADDPFIVIAHDGLHRQAILRRRFQSTEVPRPREGQVEWESH